MDEKFEEKIGEKMNLCVVWIRERGKKIFVWSSDIFHLGPHKTFLSKMDRKDGRKR